MRFLNKISDAGSQRFFLTGIPGQRIVMDLRYMPSQELWMMDIEYGDFALRGIVVTASVNLLRNYKNIIPFGISCTTIDGLDPYYIDDFSTQRASLFLMDQDDVQAVERGYFTHG